jgi:acyl dehydratase
VDFLVASYSRRRIMTTIAVAHLKDRVGQEVAVGDWLEVTQDRITQFAEAIEDRQWIHVDAARARVESPFKTTIAHGFLTLSLVSTMLRNAVTITGVRMAMNYGFNRVRLTAPVSAGSRIRGRFTLAAVEATVDSLQATWAVAVERQGEDKPACVAEWLVRYYPG